MNDVLDVLLDARAEIAAPDRWYKGQYTPKELDVDYGLGDPTQPCCIEGALTRSLARKQNVPVKDILKQPSRGEPTLKRDVWQVARMSLPVRFQALFEFNDADVTRHPHVLKLLDDAIERSKA